MNRAERRTIDLLEPRHQIRYQAPAVELSRVGSGV